MSGVPQPEDQPVPPPPLPPSSRGHGRALVGSASALLSSRLVVAVLGWAGSILVVRSLSASEWGQFSLVFTVLGMVGFMTSLGSSRIVLTELTRLGPADSGAYAGSYVMLRMLLGTMAYAVAVGFVVVAGYPREVVTATALAGVVLILGAGASGLDVVFQSALRLGAVATANVLGQLGQLALTAAVAVARPSLLMFVLPAIAYDAIAGWWKVRKVRPLLRIRLRVDVPGWGRILVQAAPLAAGTAFASIALSTGLIVLSKVDSFARVGELAVADKFVMIVAFVPLAVGPPLIALLVRSWPDRPDTFYANLRRGTLLMSLAAGLLLVGFVPVAGDIMALLYGEEYRSAETAAQLSVVAACLQFYSHIALVGVVAMGRSRDYMLFHLIALLLTLGTSLALIPFLSVLGAGLARTVTALVMLVFLALLVRRRMTGRFLDGRKQVVIGLAAGAGLGTGALLQLVLWWPLACAAGVLLYLAVLELTKVTGPAGLRSLGRDDANGDAMAGSEPGPDRRDP